MVATDSSIARRSESGSSVRSRIADGEKVERHERRWGLGGQLLHPTVGGVDALQEGVEVQSHRTGDQDLAVDDTPGGEMAAHRGDDRGSSA